MKKRGMKKRVLAALMTACMVVGSVPGVSLADVSAGETTTNQFGLTPSSKKYNFDGSSSESDNSDIVLNKQATYLGDDTYEITLSATAKNQIKTKPMQVVFLLDASGSMNWCDTKAEEIKCTEKEVKKLDGHKHYIQYKHKILGIFYDDYQGNGCTLIDKGTKESRWTIAENAIQKMSENLKNEGIDCKYVWFNDNTGDSQKLDAPYDDVPGPIGGTNLSAGVRYALGKFEDDSKDDSKDDLKDKVLIIVADGESNDGYPNKEVDNFKSASQNNKVYTVGFTFSSNAFGKLASQDCNFEATDAAKLQIALNKISQNLKSMIIDPLGEQVELAGPVTVTGSTSPAKDQNKEDIATGSDELKKVEGITWNDPNGLQGTVELKYKVKVKDKTAGTVKLNGNAKLSFENSAGGTSELEFPTPEVQGAALEVKYVCDGAEIKEPDTDWVGFTSENVSFEHIKTIPEEINVNGVTYYTISSTPKTIPTPTEAKKYEVIVSLSTERPRQNEYSVVYDADGGKWDDAYVPEPDYELNSDRSQLTRTNVTANDMIEVLAGEKTPKKQGCTFKGWQLVMGTDSVSLFRPMRVGQVASKVEGQENAYRAYVKAIWEEDGSSEENNITYSVNQHYIAPDHTDNVSIKDLTAGKDASIKDAISGYTQNLPWRGDTYLYRRTTVTTGGQTVDYNPDTARFTENTTIDIYYYRDSWNAGNNSETGGDGTPDTEQVLVKFGSKDRGDWVTGSGIVQVYTLDEGKTIVTPSKDNVTVSCGEGYHFTKWTKNNSVNEIDPFTEQTGVKGGETINFWAWFAADEVKVPKKPVSEELPYVTVICTNTNASHSVLERNYYILGGEIDEGRVIVGDVKYDSTNGNYVSHVKVMGAYYAGLFDIGEGGNHIATKANDVSFDMVWDGEKWTAPDSIDTIKISCAGSEDPEGPTEDELKDLIKVALVHTGSNAHPNENYTLIADSYDVETNGRTAVVTVKADKYVKEYNSQYGEHAVQGKNTAKLVFDHTGAGWKLVNDNAEVSFTVKCSEKKPESPKGPTKEDLKKLFGNAITVICTTDADHAEETFGLIDGSFHFSKDKDVDDEGVVTVNADKYIKAFNDGNHTNAGDDGARVKLYYDADEAKWCADKDINITFKAKCEKTPETPEKQYTEIKFVVVNGTFTENGQTELTKTFEVGTKLTIADIPASKGKSSSYSDQTWDKFPVGYVVGKDGTTFTITYKWRSSGSGSDDSDYDYGTSTRGKATNAAGKSGRWILEGGEFTEDNGRLPSNEYLKIGDTIYGFYTYGFAIDFDRPEYYTDAAIQAKGGYRDATGTWRLNGWWFCYDDGTFPHDEWVYLTWNGRSDWYYFDVDGWMEDGWLYRNNNWYYLHTQYDNTRGHMYTGWHEIDGKWYYFNTASDKGTLGAMLANTTTPDGYQVDANGAWIQ